MKKAILNIILTASVAVMMSCSADDKLEEYNGNSSWNSGTSTAGGSSVTTGELATLDVAIDKTTTEPTDVAAAYYPTRRMQIK